MLLTPAPAIFIIEVFSINVMALAALSVFSGSSPISVIMISQGSSEFNISFVVKKKDAYKAAQAIHDMFEMGM